MADLIEQQVLHIFTLNPTIRRKNAIKPLPRRALNVPLKSAAIPMLALAASVLLCGCTGVDKFTVHNISNVYGESASLEKSPLVLKEPCKYVAGTDLSGKLSPGPLQPDAVATPAPSNSRVKEPIYLIQIGDLQVQGAQGAYDIASFIGVRKDGAFVRNVLLHSDMPGASPFAYKSAKIRFTPENCRFSMEAVNAQGVRSSPK